MKRLLIVFLFLIIPFSFPSLTFAQTPIPTAVPTSAAETPPAETGPSLWDIFWNWITGIFIKTDYTIAQRLSNEVNSDMTDYGAENDKTKHSSSGTRLTASSSQNCYKGNVIKKVILETSGYPDSNLSQICLDSSNKCVVKTTSDSTDGLTDCGTVSIKDLAHYFVQINQKFYCDDQNSLIDIESNVINKVNEQYPDSISEAKKTCYQDVYNDFYLVPKDSTDKNEENSKKIVQTPIAAKNQTSSEDSGAIKEKLNLNFIPANKKWDGLGSLRPEDWDDASSESWGTGEEPGGDGVATGSCNAISSHCRGMSQYGALGLSQSGKSYEDILKFYYGNVALKTIDTSQSNIIVNPQDDDNCSNYQPLNIEVYLSGLGEMPNYWGNFSKGGYESMKAQVVAARTYAYMRTQSFTKPICSNSNCQNFRCDSIKSKPNLDQAIQDTKGQILVDYVNQTPFSTEYARSFCGPSKTVVYSNHTNPSVDGYSYEVQARNGQEPFCK